MGRKHRWSRAEYRKALCAAISPWCYPARAHLYENAAPQIPIVEDAMLKEQDRGKFKDEATVPGAPKWAVAIGRRDALYSRESDIRTPFGRDYTRILHSTAYRRLKHKTQVFFSPENDHVSTRIDHVHYVVSISRIIADFLGLNGELTEAIAIGHDLGHPPFGHDGEMIIGRIAAQEKTAGEGRLPFWHGRNGLKYVDDLELLTGPDGRKHNLDLTYGVRDGIIAHSGPVGSGGLFPRNKAIDLADFRYPGEYEPYTWEGCIIKLADNISYLGRDIDDAMILGIMDQGQYHEVSAIVDAYTRAHGDAPAGMNNANVIHLMVTDLCENSSPERGLCFSPEASEAMAAVLEMNRKYIYYHPRLQGYKDYGERIIHTVYDALWDLCTDLEGRLPYYRAQFPLLTDGFTGWFANYSDSRTPEDAKLLANRVIYHHGDGPAMYKQAILDYISGMTDRYIEKLYREQITF